MRSPVAIVGMACRYPDADDVGQLLENSLAQRRSFRSIPEGRLAATGYFGDAGSSPDRAYSRQAAVLKGFEFDRARFRISQSSYDATDLTHWLALTVAREAIEDIRFRSRTGHPHGDAVRVVVGNTLAGEFSRASLMRLRWPYVQRVVGEQLRHENPAMEEAECARLLEQLEVRYKAPFPAPNEDFLAGGLSNTIAGRICNHFDFRGGCYTVDGACSSSLLAVADACSALAAGDADMVLAGGVDLSLDPFELVGFSRSGALAQTDMLVYDENAQGFWPGEGCGFVALMRHEDALAECERIYGVIHGWGISSDGRGGLTRPVAEGQRLAIRRCYQRAGFGIETVGYFEGHGTGTRVGDAVELQAIIGARTDAGGPVEPAVISSVKANIGHTKAAAGVAGLLRATMCLVENVLPPATACPNPHPLLLDGAARLSVAQEARPWPSDGAARRAGVSASGFGGINSHITVEEVPAASPSRTVVVGPGVYERLRGAQDAELFLFGAARQADLAWTIDHVAGLSAECSRAELTDLAVEMGRRATRGAWSPWKAAVVASTPSELRERLARLRAAVESFDEPGAHLAVTEGVFLSSGDAQKRIGLVFSGQGSPARAAGGISARRFGEVSDVYRAAGLGAFATQDDTDFAQLAIVTASMGGLALLDRLGTTADVAIGHSLGELTALHWAGHYDGPTLLAIARARGVAMAADPDTRGAMAAIATDPDGAAAAIAGHSRLHIANLNGPRQTIVAGPREDIDALVLRLRGEGTAATVLAVRQAFHTSSMAGAVDAFVEAIQGMPFGAGRRAVVSTVTGARLPPDTDIVDHLRRQGVSPVRFDEAARVAAADVDLLLEVGPGHVMADVLRGLTTVPVVPLDIGGPSLSPSLLAAGAAYVLGRAPEIGRLYADRFARPFDWTWHPKFLTNPCEADVGPGRSELVVAGNTSEARELSPSGDRGKVDRLREIIAAQTGLPVWTIEDGSRMLSDLHLNSITVGEIIARFVVACELPLVPVDTTEYADASLVDIAAALERLASAGGAAGTDRPGAPAGVDDWVRSFELTRAPAPALAAAGELGRGEWEAFVACEAPERRLLDRLNDGSHGSGVIVVLGRGTESGAAEALLRGAQRCTERAREGADRMLFVVVQPGWGGGGFARSWFLEERIDTLVVNVPADGTGDTRRLIVAEIEGRHPEGQRAGGPLFHEVFLDGEGSRAEQRLRLVAPSTMEPLPIGKTDVVLVTGGGKGISAECAHQLALRTGCALLIVGRSASESSGELGGNLERLRRTGVRVSYQAADVTDRAALCAAVADGVAELDAPVTGIVHGAGTNHPRIVADLALSDMESTLAPKVGGLRNLLAAVNPDDLRLLVAFSSIIARIGLRGEADYALANEWLSHETEAFAALHPRCRCRSIEWSVWSGTGMGQRLGGVDALVRQGISPLAIDAGVKQFQRLIDAPPHPVSVVVTGRFGSPPTLHHARPDARPSRFIESTPIFYPGVELVAECRVSLETDPYLDDHVLATERLFPAVMALEAMTEAANLLTGSDGETTAPSFRDVRFRTAIVVSPGAEGITLRVASLADPDGGISFAVRSSTTNFRINHVEARCILRPRAASVANGDMGAVAPYSVEASDAARALYRSVLFQTGRFQRVASYSITEARRCAGRLSPDGATRWFSVELPQPGLVLGDPGARDAALHSIQACIPHKVVIPTGVGAIDAGVLDPTEAYSILAEETADRGDELVYNLTICDHAGCPVEQWRDITLRVVGEPANFCLDTPSLMGPFFERHVAAREPAALVRVALMKTIERRTATTRPDHRPDGRPDPEADGRARSVSYNGDLRLDVSAAVPTGCDLESVQQRSRDLWRALLGVEGLELADVVAEVAGETLDVSATRVWTAREAMKKAGLAVTAPLVVDPDSSARWVVLRSGDSPVFSSLIEASADQPARCVSVALVRPTGDGRP